MLREPSQQLGRRQTRLADDPGVGVATPRAEAPLELPTGDVVDIESAIASIAGWRKVGGVTSRPKRTGVVSIASAPSNDQASYTMSPACGAVVWSAIQMLSKPGASMRRQRPASSRYGAACNVMIP